MDLEKSESFIFLFMPFLTLSSFPDCKLSYIKGRYCYVQNQQALYPQQNHIRNSIVESRSCMMWGIKLKRWVALDGFLNLVTHRWISETLGTPWNALYRNFGGRAVGLCLFKCSKEFRLPLPKKKGKTIPFGTTSSAFLPLLDQGEKECKSSKTVGKWSLSSFMSFLLSADRTLILLGVTMGMAWEHDSWYCKTNQNNSILFH